MRLSDVNSYLRQANAMADSGEAELLAIMQNTAPIQCAGAISVLNHYYGRDSVPIAAYNVSTIGATLEMEDPLPYGKHAQQVERCPVLFMKITH